MSVAPGTRLGPYEIVAPVGAGGMGEVFRGRDTRLGRDVAIKVLPEGFARDDQFRARFEREAKTISSLNHPNICTLFDVGHENGTHFLVMELIEGETLADRLVKGPLPLDQVLRIGAQVADALDRAHKQGIVHRDLKPGNVMITRSGAKLLDFGLARSGTESGVLQGSLAERPTEAKPLTREGTILGTIQYMAPEQLEGQEADARTDIFALGALLYEMATARKAFQGATKTSLIAAIVSSHPEPISSVSPMSPPGLDHIVRKCLEKDPDDRWQSAHDVAGELRWLSEAGSQAGVATSLTLRRKTREKLAWALAALFAIAAVALAGALLTRRPQPAKTFRGTIDAPAGTALIPFDYLGIAMSPDGTQLAFAANNAAGGQQLWVRNLASHEATAVPETTGATYPFWSPDGQHLGFFAEGKLKKIDLRGGSPQTLADAPSGRGGSWSEEGVIIYAASIRSPIQSIPASGGKPKSVTRFDASTELTHRWPRFLPDGRHFFYVSRQSVVKGEVGKLMVGSLEGGQGKLLIEDSSNAVFVQPGFLLYGRRGDLFAWRFDPKRMELVGQPAPVLSQKIGAWEPKNMAVFDSSQEGTLAYLPEVTRKTVMRWVGRDGRTLGELGAEAFNVTPRISPDGSKVAVSIAEAAPFALDLWVIDLRYDRKLRLSQRSGIYFAPAWKRDSSGIAFICQPKSVQDVCWKSLAAATDIEVLFESPYWKSFPSWSADGRLLYLTEQRPDTVEDIIALDVADRQKKTSTVLSTPFSEDNPEVSPDGRWIAYSSNESGRLEIFVRPLSGSFEQWQISSSGAATNARWARGGKELMFAAAEGKMMAVDIATEPVFRAGVPRPLFNLPETPDRDNPMFEDVTADGERILLTIPTRPRSSVSFNVVLNWPALMK